MAVSFILASLIFATCPYVVANLANYSPRPKYVREETWYFHVCNLNFQNMIVYL